MAIDNCFSVGAGAVAFLSAALWVFSAQVHVTYNPKPDNDGWYSAAITDENDDDVIETMKKQNRWNRYATYAAAVAAILQGISLFLTVLK